MLKGRLSEVPAAATANVADLRVRFTSRTGVWRLLKYNNSDGRGKLFCCVTDKAVCKAILLCF